VLFPPPVYRVALGSRGLSLSLNYLCEGDE